MKALINIFHFFRKIYWFIFRPQTFGVKAIVEKGGEVLLIKNTYENQLMLPGGKLGRKETPEKAIVRELKEEVGVVTKNVNLIGTFTNELEYKKDTIYLFKVDDFEVQIDSSSPEVEKWAFYDKNNLPSITSAATVRRVKEGEKITSGFW